MKNLYLFLIIIISFVGFSQTPKRAYDLSNSLYDFWENGETEKAVSSTLELYSLNGERLFINKIHSELSQMLKKSNTNYELNYLESLYLKKNTEINHIITPIYLWGKSLVENDSYKLNKIAKECEDLLGTSSEKSLTERYMLLIVKELAKKNAADIPRVRALIEKTNKSLENELFKREKEVSLGGEKLVRRAWCRYLLSAGNIILYVITDSVDCLKKASDFSPDILDMYNEHAYFYDAYLLNGDTKEIGFKSFYKEYLIEKNEQKELLSLLSEIYLNNPSEENRQELQNCYKKTSNGTSFKNYWENYINTIATDVPKIKVSFPNEVLDLTVPTNSWIFLDFWGTWCAPCVKDLPKLQELYTENQKSGKLNLKIYTFSYNSIQLDKFMTKKGYTFPVIPVDEQFINDFFVQGFPTKILITPQNKFIRLPYVPDWEKYLKGYIITDK